MNVIKDFRAWFLVRRLKKWMYELNVTHLVYPDKEMWSMRNKKKSKQLLSSNFNVVPCFMCDKCSLPLSHFTMTIPLFSAHGRGKTSEVICLLWKESERERDRQRKAKSQETLFLSSLDGRVIQYHTFIHTTSI